ncbi:MAG: glycoside hydrolase family 3 C-terminal domain-containing protein [Flavobacteriales bacterium]|nr:glycoside hydrolase family 3 C-terminal domain-containing protein [Flavobacteriales bacterium]
MEYKVYRNCILIFLFLNTGNIMDMTFFDECTPDALLYVWQGGMTGGTGTADVLTGRISPSHRPTF